MRPLVARGANCNSGTHILPILPVRNRGKALACLLLAGVLPAYASPAPRSAAGITVGATVRAYARIESVEAAKTLRITAEDIQRGWVDVRTNTHIKVKTNAPRGYHLQVKIDSAQIWLTEIRGLPDHPAFGPAGGHILRRTSGPTQETLDLGFRFHLAKNIEPGTIDWPVGFSVRPR